MEKCRMRLIVEVFYNGKWHQRESEITGLKRLDADKIYQVYELHRELADTQSDAVQWTAEMLQVDRSTVYRAIHYCRNDKVQNVENG